MDTPFLNNINKTIGDNMRFAKAFNANPEAFINEARSKSAQPQSDPFAGLLHPLLLMMMFQMMQQLMPAGGQAGDPEAFPSNWNVPLELMTQRNPLSPSPPSDPPPVQVVDPPPPPENPALISLREILSQDQTTLALQMTRLQDGLKNQFFTASQLTQGLKQLLDTAPEDQLPLLSDLSARLLETGAVNADSFMNDDYLAQLSEARRTVLMDIISDAGLRLENGKPNTRLSGILLQYAHQPKLPNTQSFIRELLQQYYDKLNGDLASTDEGKTLNSLFLLGNITVNDQQRLVFPA